MRLMRAFLAFLFHARCDYDRAKFSSKFRGDVDKPITFKDFAQHLLTSACLNRMFSFHYLGFYLYFFFSVGLM